MQKKSWNKTQETKNFAGFITKGFIVDASVDSPNKSAYLYLFKHNT